MKKIWAILLAVMIATASALFSQTAKASDTGVTWTKYPGNPMNLGAGQLSRPWVIYDGEMYKMWYTVLAPEEAAEKICFADSPDGFNWATHGVVLEGSSGSWDACVLDPMVLYDGTTYKMWYIGAPVGSPVGKVGYAMSSDGVSWTKRANPVLVPGGNGGWDDFSIAADGLIVVFDGTHYIMWYSGEAYYGGTNMVKAGVATSVDGINWAKYSNNPVLAPSPNSWESGHVWAGPVIRNGDHYEMWYTGQQRDYPKRIGLATSPDGFSWSRYENNPVLENGPSGSWDSLNIVSSCVVEKGGNLLLWYYGSNGETVGIGLAVMVMTLPAGAWWPPARIYENTETILQRIDVDSETLGDQQVVCAYPGQTITVSYTFQMWSSGGPGIIKQAWFAYSWASAWPPWDAYTPLYDGGSGGYYPGFTKTDSFTITVPTTPGKYDVWFCTSAHYSMNLAIQELTEPPDMPPHAIIMVGGGDFKIHPFPTQQSTLQGKSAGFSIFVDPLQGFDSEVSLTLSGLPVGASYTFEPERSSPPFSSKLTIMTERSTPEGMYTLTVAAMGGGKTHSTTMTLLVVSLWINPEFDTTIPEDNRTYIQNLFEVVYPEIVEVYNYPSTRYLLGKTAIVTIHYDSTTAFPHYDNKHNRIVLQSLPHPYKNQPNEPRWDQTFTHELVHAFHDGLMDKFNTLTWKVGDWFEEGMTEATAEMTAHDIQPARDIAGGRELSLSLRYYDSWNIMGGDVLGGFESTNKLAVLADPYYSSAAAIWYILTTGLSTNPDNPFDFMSRLNKRMYDDLNGVLVLSEDWIKGKIAEVAGAAKIEGKSTTTWLNLQSVIETNPTSGVHLAVCFPEYQGIVKVVAFGRSPITGRETGRAANVKVKIVDSSGSVVCETTLTTDQSTGLAMWPVPNYPLPSGSYEIIADTKIGRTELNAKNYIVSSGVADEAKGPDTNIYGASLNSNGEPIERSFSVTGGEISNLANGAFTLSTSTSTVPFEITVQSEGFETKIEKPNPFTRVVFITFPTNSP